MEVIPGPQRQVRDMIPWTAIPNRIIYVLKRLLGERALASASVIRRGLHVLVIPPIHVSPAKEARTSKRLCYGFPDAHEHRS